MRLYRIQDKNSGKFFAGIEPLNGQLMMTDSGAFFKKIDTIMKHLEYLSGEYVARERDGFPRWTGYRYKKTGSSLKAARKASFYVGNSIRYFDRTYPARLDNYVVVVNEVLVQGEEFIPTSEFMESEHDKAA